MADFKKIYRTIGVRKLPDFIAPKILIDTEFVFPKKSTLHWITDSDLPSGPSVDNGYLANVKAPHVVTVHKYINPIGNHRYEKSTLTKNISKLKKGSPKFKFYSTTVKKISVQSTTLLIYNYGLLKSVYKYQINQLAVYHKWYNNFNTIIETIATNKSKSPRNNFILVELPTSIPSRFTLDKYTSNVTKITLEKLPTEKHLILLELWKWLTPDVAKDSIFSKLTKRMLNETTLIFKHGGKVALLNLGILTGAVKEYNLDSGIKKLSADMLRKLFLIYVLKIATSTPISYRDAERTDVSLVNIDSTASSFIDGMLGDNEDNDSSVDVNAILDNEFVYEDEDKLPEEDDYDGVVSDMVASIDMGNIDESFETHYTAKKDILNDSIDYLNFPKDIVNKLKQQGAITNKAADKFNSILNDQDLRQSPYAGDERTTREMLTITEEELRIDKEATKLPPNKVVLDKSMLFNTVRVFDTKYIKETHKKDVVSVIYSLQSAGILVSNYDITETTSVLGTFEEHTISLIPLNGKPSTIKLKLPKINEDGTYMMSGNSYRLRKQKSDIPIRKIGSNRVSLSSYYNKVFVSKALNKKDDKGFWFRKQLLLAREKDDNVKNIVFANNNNVDLKLPLAYSVISRYVKSFAIGELNFGFTYKTRTEFKKHIKTLTRLIEKNGTYTIVGKNTKRNSVLVMDKDGIIYDGFDKHQVKLGDIYELLNIDLTKQPMEYASIRIFRKTLPVSVLLSYYVGFSNLLKILAPEVEEVDGATRRPLAIDEYAITFKDKKFILKKNDVSNSTILGGLSSINQHLKQINVSVMNNKEAFPVLFNLLELPILYINEIKLLENMFVDPITKNVLEVMKEPTTFKGLLLRACELLEDDNYIHPNNLDGMLIKGYERVAGMIYTQLVKDIREYENKNVFSKAKITNDPYSVWRSMGDDSTSILIDDLNPMAMLKQTDDITLLGAGGRSKDTLAKSTRAMHVSEIGVISEATKDSGDVGISAYMTANPNLGNTRGIKTPYDVKDSGMASKFSTSALLAPGGINDDVKRLNFASIMNSHIVPMEKMTAPSVRTGYESVIPYRTEEKFAYMATDNGVVETVSKNVISIKYDTGDSKKLKLQKWSTKVEAGISYQHETITDLKKGDKFKLGETISYDKTFFEPDIFDSKRVIYKSGNSLDVALIETMNTHEDSCAISLEAAKGLATSVYKKRSYIVKSTDAIIALVKAGDKVEPRSSMFTITDDTVKQMSNFDNDSLKTLQRLKQPSPKADTRGAIGYIEIFYNDDFDNLSDTLKEVVTISDKELAIRHGKLGLTGRVTGEYSVNGKSLAPGTVEIKVFIKMKEDMGVGDKGIFANQLKSTVGEVYQHPVMTEDGKTNVEAIFSTRSIQARIVNSPDIIGTTATLLEKISDKAVDIYFK